MKTIFFFIIFIILIISYLLYLPLRNSNIKSVYVGDGSNMKLCPKGCVRGVNSLGKYDFKCNYCQDPTTGKYYINSVVNPKLEVLYNSSNIKETNETIKHQNEYILKINKEIMKINEQNSKLIS